MPEALIHNNKVIQVEATTFPVSSGLSWVTSATAKVGDDYDSGTGDFTTPAIPGTTIDQVKAEARRRIEAAMPAWMVAREVSGGAVITQTIKDYAAAIRTDSSTLEGTLPVDYIDDSHWTAAPS